MSAGTVIPAGGVTSLFADAALIASVANAAAAASAAPMPPPRRRFYCWTWLSFRISADAECAAGIEEYVDGRAGAQPKTGKG